MVQLFMLFLREVNGIYALGIKVRRIAVDQAVRPVTFPNDVQTIFILNDHILQAFRSIIKKVKKVRQVVRPDSKRAGRAAETAATDLVIRGRPLDIEQAASPPQDLQEFFPFLTRKALHHSVSLVYNSLLQKLLVLHELF